jgi:hypothetical protein
MEAQVGQFLVGCKCPVSRFLPGRATDLSVPLYQTEATVTFMPKPRNLGRVSAQPIVAWTRYATYLVYRYSKKGKVISLEVRCGPEGG